MTRIFLLDDDSSVTQILQIIINDKKLGMVCGTSDSAVDALEILPSMNPDIVIVDLLMPDMDGITFVKSVKEKMNNASFIMLSQVSSKDMIAKAYEAGVEFFIQKPINGIEVINVVEKVARGQALERAMNSVQSLFAESKTPVNTVKEETSEVPDYQPEIRRILQKIGISGERGSDDIVDIVSYLCQHPDEISKAKLSDICSKFTEAPKSMEQRMRRAAASGLSNIAHIGLDDYGNEVFERYAASLFKFEQVRKEMDYIKGNSGQHGNVQIKKFIIALVNAAME